jgi:hypothetical protein
MTNYEIAEQRIAEARETEAGKLNLGNLQLTELPPHLLELDLGLNGVKVFRTCKKK